ncbi:MAG TPA: PEP-CTERM sorting domain-containing protein [Myxococcota bacterium]|nr:PEP-CTERM sorting domain-containing protein [Myxococcota bacterium]
MTGTSLQTNRRATGSLFQRESRRGLRLLLAIAFLGALGAAPAGATVLKASASSFTGDPLTVSIEIDDQANPGSLSITLAVDGDGDLGDLRGFFAQVSDESLLSGLSASGSLIGKSVFEANRVINLGRGANLNGGGTACPCDLGIEIGAPGIGKGDDFRSVSFVLSHVSEDLSASFLRGQEFGVRVTSVGLVGGDREGSSKLAGVVPEPTTAMLMLLGLAGLASVGRSPRSRPVHR